MDTGRSNTLVMASLDDLQKLIDDNLVAAKYKAMLSRFDNILVGTKEIAKFHSVNERTVLNYVRDGLLIPEAKLGENDHPRFRLSYALTLDFKDLQKQLRAKNKGW